MLVIVEIVDPEGNISDDDGSDNTNRGGIPSSATSFDLGVCVKVNGIQISGLNAKCTFRSFAALFADLQAEYQRTERKRHRDTCFPCFPAALWLLFVIVLFAPPLGITNLL